MVWFLVMKVSLILFLTFSPKRIGKPARNFSFQKGVFVPLKVVELLTSKVGKEFDILIFQMGRVSDKM
jgi:hypothetical protein